MTTFFPGIDISKHNGVIDFAKVKAANTSVVIIKATEGGSYLDPMLETNYKNAKAAGMKIGFYHYLYELSDAKRQANWFWENIKNKKFDIIPVLDAERTEKKQFTKTEYTNFCLEFLEEFERLSGIKCIFYSYTSFINNKIDNRLKPYKLWVAHYNKNDGSYDKAGTNNVWGNEWVGHQFTSVGRIQGVNGNVDCNLFTEDIFINGIAEKPTEGNKPQNKGECKVYELVKNKAVVRGSTGSHVYLMQSMLKVKGMYEGTIDGKAEYMTEKAIINYNTKYGLSNGNAKSFGPKCWYHIFHK